MKRVSLFAVGFTGLLLMGAGCQSPVQEAKSSSEYAVDVAADAKQKTSELESRIIELELKLDQLSSRLDDVDTDDVTDKINELDSRMDDTETSISDLQYNMSAAERKIRNLEYNQ